MTETPKAITLAPDTFWRLMATMQKRTTAELAVTNAQLVLQRAVAERAAASEASDEAMSAAGLVVGTKYAVDEQALTLTPQA